MSLINEKNYSHKTPQRIGVLITNLGTPEKPTPSALRAYLKQFLGDNRVIEVPRWKWNLILYCIILPFRSPASAKKYASIWSKEGSPLLKYSQEIVTKITHVFQKKNIENFVFELAMTYNKPSIIQALSQLKKKNCRKILVLPLYPQYSSTTTAPVFIQVTKTLAQWRWIPELHFINQYHDENIYIEEIASTIVSSWKKRKKPEKIIFSYHGIPLKGLLNGDPYHCQCYKTTRLICEKLQLNKNDYMTTFQSRFGKQPWLQPYTDKTLIQLAKDGIKNVDVICPGFACDCLETLEEICEENKEYFLHNGGENFHYIPCLNSTTAQINVLTQLVQKHTDSWNMEYNEKIQNEAFENLYNKHSFYREV